MKLPATNTYGFWLGIFRIYVGLFWLAHAIPKFQDGFMPPDGFIVSFLNNAATSSTGPYHQFVVSIVLPNIVLFANLVRIGELLTACVLILGFYSRIGAFVGMILSLNYLSAQNAIFSAHGWSSVDGATFIMCFMNLVIPTGLYFGLDGMLHHGRANAAVSTTPVNAGPKAVQAEFVDEPPKAT